MKSSSLSRIVTTGAIGFLTLDAALFAVAGRYLWASGCALAAIVVIIAWRRYRRVMAELAEERRDMKREAESLRDLLHTYLRN